MSTTGINHFNLRAPRLLLEELREFYCAVVGLVQGARPAFLRFGYFLYAGKQDVLHLTESQPDEIRSTEVKTTFDHIAFTGTDLTAVESRLTRHGVSFERGEIPSTRQRQLFFRDPAGNGVELTFTEE